MHQKNPGINITKFSAPTFLPELLLFSFFPSQYQTIPHQKLQYFIVSSSIFIFIYYYKFHPFTFFSQFIFWKRIDNFIKHFLLRHTHTYKTIRDNTFECLVEQWECWKNYMKWYDFIGLFPSDINTLTQKRMEETQHKKKSFSSGEWKGI